MRSWGDRGTPGVVVEGSKLEGRRRRPAARCVRLWLLVMAETGPGLGRECSR